MRRPGSWATSSVHSPGVVERRGHDPEVLGVEVGERRRTGRPSRRRGTRRPRAGRARARLGRRVVGGDQTDLAARLRRRRSITIQRSLRVDADVEEEPLVGFVRHEHVVARRRCRGGGARPRAGASGRRGGRRTASSPSADQATPPHDEVPVISSGRSAPVSRSRTRSVYRSPPSVSLDQASRRWSGDGSTAWTSKYSWPSASTFSSRITVRRRGGSSTDRPRQCTGYDGPRWCAVRTTTAVEDRHGQVGLLDAALDLLVQVSTRPAGGSRTRRGVGVLGLEVGDGVGVVAVAQPRPGSSTSPVGRSHGAARGCDGSIGVVERGGRCAPGRAWPGAPTARVALAPVPCRRMRVWIDQDLCTGDGLCVDHCPDVFTQLEDGIAYVTEAGRRSTTPAARGPGRCRARHVGSVIHAAEDCPGECIFIEIDARSTPSSMSTSTPASQPASRSATSAALEWATDGADESEDRR